VSGRASYELVQKALAGGIPIVCSISAPSSLAIETARTFGLTLVGFVNGTSANVYAGEERVGVPATASSPPRRTAGTGR
ncbi:MAG: formate dehydrogenase accessory sulfurtransferase FdhD, partial [Vulcanimicrobiaceae bacterium]